MNSHVLDAIRVSHGVLWHAGGTPGAGRLVIGPDSIRLLDVMDDDSVVAEIAFEDLGAVRLPHAAKGRRVIVLESRRGKWVEIETAGEQQVLPELLEAATRALLAEGHRALLVSIRFRLGALQHATEIACGDSPLPDLPNSVDDVFLLGDELLLVFGAEHLEDSSRRKELWDVVAGWEEQILEIGFADHFWSRAHRIADDSVR